MAALHIRSTYHRVHHRAATVKERFSKETNSLQWWSVSDVLSAIGQPVAQKMLLAWLAICIASVIAGFLTISWASLTISLLTTFWLGLFWGIVPAYITALVITLSSGMPLATSLVCSLAMPITLTVLWSSATMLRVSPSLATWADRAKFALLALIAVGASSSLRRGRVVSDFLQIVLITAPLLACLTAKAQRWIAPRITLPPRRSLDTRFYIAVFILVSLVIIATGAQSLTAVGFWPVVVVFSYTLGSQIEQHRQKAYTDELTKCLNRHAFDDIFAVEAARCERLGLGLSLIAIDLDHFKSINDQFGHAAGDDVLQAFAQRVYGAIRRSDFFFRSGGDEFTLLLPCTEPSEAAELAERLRRALEAEPLHGTKLTATFGVAGTSKFPVIAADLLKAADTACYGAKEKGRNRVEICVNRRSSPANLFVVG